MQQFNFQPLNFSTLGGYQQRYDQARQAADEARRRKYDAFGNVITAAGRGASDTVNAYGDWRKEKDALERQEEQQRKVDEWRQRQWDYQVGRDKIMDQRYQQQFDQSEAERLDDMRRGAKLRESFLSQYGNVDLNKYGPHAGFAMERIRNARTWGDVVGGGESLASIIQQKDLLDAQRAEQQAANIGPDTSNQINAELSLMGIDPKDPAASVWGMKDRNFYKDEDALFQINSRMKRLDDVIRSGHGSREIYDQRSALAKAAELLRRRMYRRDKGGKLLTTPRGTYLREDDL